MCYNTEMFIVRLRENCVLLPQKLLSYFIRTAEKSGFQAKYLFTPTDIAKNTQIAI